MLEHDTRPLLKKADELIGNRDYDSALSILSDLDRRHDLPPEIVLEVRFLTGSAYYERGEYDLATPLLENVVNGPSDHPDRADALMLMGYIRLFKAFEADDAGDEQRFLEEVRAALPFFERFAQDYADRQDVYEAYGRIGQCHLELEQLQQALDFYWKAKEHCSDESQIAFYLRKLGTIYQDLEEYPTAAELLEQSLKYPDTPNGRAHALSNLGRVALFVDDEPEQAGRFFSEALELFDPQQDDYVEASHDHALYGMGEVLLEAGELQGARYYLERVLRLDNPHTGNAELAAEALFEIATTKH